MEVVSRKKWMLSLSMSEEMCSGKPRYHGRYHSVVLWAVLGSANINQLTLQNLSSTSFGPITGRLQSQPCGQMWVHWHHLRCQCHYFNKLQWTVTVNLNSTEIPHDFCTNYGSHILASVWLYRDGARLWRTWSLPNLGSSVTKRIKCMDSKSTQGLGRGWCEGEARASASFASR